MADHSSDEMRSMILEDFFYSGPAGDRWIALAGTSAEKLGA